MEAVRCGMAVRAASNEFGIPRRTLRNHVSSGSATKRIGRPCILTEERELDLESRIVRLADVGMPITSKCLRRSVYKYVEIMKIPHNFPSLTALAGRKWVKLFLKRHPNISRRKAQHMNVARSSLPAMLWVRLFQSNGLCNFAPTMLEHFCCNAPSCWKNTSRLKARGKFSIKGDNSYLKNIMPIHTLRLNLLCGP
nr:unnamed protein product [Callosobruchus analis]